MKVDCPSCSASFLAPDDKIRGRVVKYRCRKCGATMVADGTKLDDAASAGDTQVMGKDEVLSGWDVHMSKPPPAARTSASPPPLPDAVDGGSVRPAASNVEAPKIPPAAKVPDVAAPKPPPPRAPAPSAPGKAPPARPPSASNATSPTPPPARLPAPSSPAAKKPPSTDIAAKPPAHGSAKPAPATSPERAPALASLKEEAAPAAALREEKSGLHDLRALAALVGTAPQPKPKDPASDRVDLVALLGEPSGNTQQKLSPPDLDWSGTATSATPGLLWGDSSSSVGLLWDAPSLPAPAAPAPPISVPSADVIDLEPETVRKKGAAAVPATSEREKKTDPPARPASRTAPGTVPPVARKSTSTAPPPKKVGVPVWIYPAAIAVAAAIALFVVRSQGTQPPATAPVATAEPTHVEAPPPAPTPTAEAPKATASETATAAPTTEPSKTDDTKKDDTKTKADAPKADAPKADAPKADDAPKAKADDAPKPKADDKPKKEEAKAEEPKKEEPKKAIVDVGGGEFDTGAARAALSAAAAAAASCRKDDGPGGVARLSVTFAPSGRVTSAVINGPPFAGTSVGGCIAAAFRSARVPPFSGDPVTVTKSVTIN